jgi:hypothetical protein
VLIGLTIFIIFAVATVFFALRSSVSRPAGVYTHEAEAWLDTFSVRAYQPMLRLASRSDRRYLQTVGDRAEAKRYRRAQRALLRGYLRSLSSDFQKLHSIATARARKYAGDESGLSLALIEEQMGFIFLMWSIEARIALNTLLPGSINLQPLLANVDILASQARELILPRLRYQVM